MAHDVKVRFVESEVSPADSKVVRTDHGVLATATCPRCHSEISRRFDRIVIALQPLDERANRPGPPDPPPGKSLTVICDCQGPHEGTPDGGAGCGAHWRVIAP